jgi:isopentenyl phosphate kinase
VLLGSDGTDVTGGMLHKVQEAIKLSDKGITTLLISSAKGNLFNALTDQLVVGTSIH